MKTLKQLREEYDSELLNSVDFLPEEIMLENSKKTSLVSSTPSFKQMPALLLFRRMTYRKYPGNQTVALYYSALVDKYLSIPFGPTGNLNLSEAVILDESPFNEETDASDETGMAKTQLRAISAKANNLNSKLKSAKNLPAWVQSKIAVAKDGITAVDDYMSHTGDKLDEEGFDLDAVTNAIRSKESRNNYNAKSGSSSASGGYQYINKTWKNSASKYGVDTKQFPTARSAPKEVQDKVFTNDLQKNASKYGSLEKAVNVHYSGNPEGKVSSAGLKANRGQTAGGYMADIKKRVDAYNTERKSTMGAAQQMAANFSGGSKSLSTPDSTQFASTPKPTQVASAPEAPKMQNPDQNITKVASAEPPKTTQISQLDTKSKKTVAESEAWQRKEGQNPKGGLNRRGILSYRRANPGSKLSMAVTTKPSKLKPGSKAANRRKSFCARMGGMKKRLTSAKTARDPDSRINKALRKWNCEEDFNFRLHELRQQRLNELSAAGVADTVTDYVVPYKSAYKELKKGNYGTAALHAGIDTAALGATALTGGAGAPVAAAGSTAAKAGLKAGIKNVATKALEKIGLKKAAAKGPMSSKADFLKTSTKAAAGKAGSKSIIKRLGASSIAKGITGSGDSDGSKSSDRTPSSHTLSTEFSKPVTVRGKKVTLSPTSGMSDPTNVSRDASLERRYREKSLQTQKVQENKMSDIRKMIKENVDYKDIYINGRSVTLNKNMAKRILEVYDSVNTKNKKIVEGMLNEDMESFKKLLNFSIKA